MEPLKRLHIPLITRLQSIVSVGVLVGVTLTVYGYKSASTPPLTSDEQRLGREAVPVATTGRDVSGRLLPLFFQSDVEVWRQPAAVYAAAGVAAVWPGVQWSVRIPSLLLAAVDIALLSCLAGTLRRHRWEGITAALLLMLTPAHFVYGRVGLDAIYAVPCALGWMLALGAYLWRPRPWLLVVATFSLGLGTLAQPAGPLIMSGLWACTVAALWLEGHRTPGPYLLAGLGFGVPLACMAAWFMAHPETYPDTMGRWAIHAAHLRNPLDGWRALTNRNTLGIRLSLFWDFFNPASLFFARDVPGAEATRGAAHLPAAFAVLVPLGVAAAWTHERRSVVISLLGALIIPPLVAATFGDTYATDRALVLVPFAALLAAYGASSWIASPRAFRRAAAALLMLTVPAQFFFFWIAYLSPRPGL